MTIWIVLLITSSLLLFLCWRRRNIPRDAGKEGADNYESTMAFDLVSRWNMMRLIRYFVIRRLKAGNLKGKLLDAGCGQGYLAIDIAQAFPQLEVIGGDKSTLMLDLANSHQSAVNLIKPVNFIEVDVQRLPFENSYLDFVISTLSLHHWNHPEEALAEFYRTLKPEGQLLIFDLRRDAPWILYFLVQVGQRILAPAPIQRVNGGIGSIWASYTSCELKGLLEQSRFQKWEIRNGWGWLYIKCQR